MSGRRRTATYGIAFGYASIGVALARNVLLVPLYLRNIPLAEYGAWLATGGALAMLLINDFGLSGVVTQRASASYGAGDLRNLGVLTGSSLAIGALLAIGLSLLSALLLPLLPGLDALDAAGRHRVAVCFLIAVTSNALTLFGGTAVSLLRSLQRPVLSGMITLAADALNIAVTVYGLFRNWGLFAIAGGFLARALIIAVAAPAGLFAIAARAVGIRIEISVAVIGELLGGSARFFLSSIAMKLQSQANLLFVSALLGPASAALYGLTVRAHETILMLIGQINGALVPSVTHLIGSGNFERFRAVLWRLTVILGTAAGFALSLTILLNAGFLHLWIGPGTFVGQPVSILMGIALFVSSIAFVAYDALVAHGRFEFVARVFVLTSVMQVAVLWAGLHLGLWVAPLVTLLTASLWGSIFWREVVAIAGPGLREWRGPLFDLARIAAVSTAVVAVFIMLYPPTVSWGAWLLEGALGAAALIAGYWLCVPRLRGIVAEEAGSSLRSLRAT